MNRHQRIRAFCHDGSITALWLIAYGVLVAVFGELLGAICSAFQSLPADYLAAAPVALAVLIYIAFMGRRWLL